jgi:hypothetical protein
LPKFDPIKKTDPILARDGFLPARFVSNPVRTHAYAQRLNILTEEKGYMAIFLSENWSSAKLAIACAHEAEHPG